MKSRSYRNQNGYRISLNKSERQSILDSIDDEDHRRAWILTSFCGLRSKEATDIRYKDVIQRDTGDYFIRVYEFASKTDKYRATPIPEKFGIELETILRSNPDIERKNKIIECSKRTLNRKLNDFLNDFVSDNDNMYIHLSFHDARRTFINCLLDDGISPLQVMEWSGHDDWKTFRDHYLSDFSEQHQSEELEKTNIY